MDHILKSLQLLAVFVKETCVLSLFVVCFLLLFLFTIFIDDSSDIITSIMY